MTTIGKAFDDVVKTYDDWIQKALPGYREIFKVANEIIPFDPKAAIDVLDLGAGTGLFAWHVLDKYPQASFTLVDLGEKMLQAAQERFASAAKSVQVRVEDYRHIQGEDSYDLVISSMSIHHLADQDKQALFRKIFSLLHPDGLFINVDQIRGETQTLKDLYRQRWLAHVRQAGASEAQIQASIERRNTYDQDALQSDQIRWLKEAGFASADCVYKHYFVGVFLAMKR
jgi:tRNA (cmo5U34)-methyltransferase